MIRICIAIVMLLSTTLASAGSALAIRNAWIGFLPGDRPSGGFFVLDNNSDREQTLVAVSSDAFDDVSMHRTVDRGEAVSMTPVASLNVPAQGQVKFAPGSYHLMLIGPQRALQLGDQVAVQFRFASGEETTVPFSIKPLWQE